ncbi:MAG: PP0621 family protein [Thiotrichaceae bacterium]
MPRLLFILILFVVSFLVVRSIRNKLDKNKHLDHKDRNSSDTKNNKTQMLKCEECGLHIPDNEAIKQGNHVFCSLEHARQRLE